MKKEGPLIEVLLRRLREIPQEFLDTPTNGSSEGIHVGALIFDLCRSRGHVIPVKNLQSLSAYSDDLQCNCVRLRSITCWVCADESLNDLVEPSDIVHFMKKRIPLLAEEYNAMKYITDSERSEEFTRLLLSDCGLRPSGETKEQAQDRLQSLSSTERKRIIASSREAEKRAREIREALVLKAAKDAADKYSRD